MPTMTLLDGRILCWAEYGDPTGFPVIYHHGAPSSRLEPLAFGLDRTASATGVRLIAPDRPGCGRSTGRPRRTLASWADDARALADHLDLDRFGVLGFSGGTGHAMALSQQIPQRVSRVAVAACVAHLVPGLEEGLDPGGLMLKRLTCRRPRLARAILTASMAAPARISPGRLSAMISSQLSGEDRDVASGPNFTEHFPRTIREAFRNGASGPQQELAMMVSPWGFDPSQIEVPVALWQGTADTFGARPAMAEHLHSLIPGSELHITTDGHLSVLRDHSAEILLHLAMPESHATAAAEP